MEGDLCYDCRLPSYMLWETWWDDKPVRVCASCWAQRYVKGNVDQPVKSEAPTRWPYQARFKSAEEY